MQVYTSYSMPITIKLFASLRKDRFDEDTRVYTSGITGRRIVQDIGIPEKEIRLVFVNGRHASLEDLLADGDTLALFPPIGGG
ncbi:MAG TPA: MoaD/ThiS family protein [Desulfomonilia bacterium]|nr:MoaD/ThiS family protein [Desulfomonilia bacterium]